MQSCTLACTLIIMDNKTFLFASGTADSLPYSDKQTEYFDESIKVPNSRLCLRVGKASKTWVLHYRKTHGGKTKKITKTLGSSNVLSLSLARKKFLTEATKLIGNTDEFIKKETASDITFDECADFYIEDRSPNQNEISVINLVKKEIGHLPMKAITRKVVRDVYEPNRKLEQYRMANYKRDIIQRIWNYNLEWNEDECTSFEDMGNPAQQKIKLLKPTKKNKFWAKKPSKAKVQDHQIKPLFDAIATLGHKEKADLIRLFFYLGQHPFTEICYMRWDQITQEDGYWWWNMEEDFHKNENTHSVPLHPTVMKIINNYKGLDDRFVFACLNRKDNQGRLLPYARGGFQKQSEAIRKLLEDNTITYQCFRATLTTKLRELGKGHEPSYLCNQKMQGISNTDYTRSEFKPLKIMMVEDWMNFIEGRLNER